MKQKQRRTPKNYDGSGSTSHCVKDILPSVLAEIGEHYSERPDLVLAAWPEIIGPQLAPMTQAVSYVDGMLVVKVKNSTLHSLLSQHEKFKILASLRKKFPKLSINNIVFRVG